MKARAKADPLYLTYLTVQNLIQSTGRGMRFHDDLCENFIVDDHIARLLATNRDQFLSWWMKLYHRANTIPDPPKALENGRGLGEGY
jgi:Rad3-related DNA helicase